MVLNTACRIIVFHETEQAPRTVLHVDEPGVHESTSKQMEKVHTTLVQWLNNAERQGWVVIMLPQRNTGAPAYIWAIRFQAIAGSKAK